MNPARHLVLVGPMGAGKTSIGRRLAARLQLRFADVDEEIERHAGSRVTTIFACEGEAGFRAREGAMLAELLRGAPAVIATGGGVVLSEDNRRAMREQGFVVHLGISIDGQLQRLARDHSRPLLATDDRAAVLRTLAQARGPLYAQVADFAFDTEGMTAPDAALALERALVSRWQRGEAAA
jgi:shikimate kinase